MTEERRTAPSTGAAGEGGEVASAAPPAENRDSEPPPAPAARRDSSPGARRRGRMTLRIPDDEVSRPQVAGNDVGRESSPPPPAVPATPTVPSPPPVEAAMLMPMRIISINPEVPAPASMMPGAPVLSPADRKVPADAPTVPRPLVGAPSDDSWTPYQPTVADEPSDAKIEALASAASEELIPIDTDLASSPESAPESLEPDDIEPLGTPVPPPPPPRALSPTEPEGEEVRFDDDVPTPAVPPVAAVAPSPGPIRPAAPVRVDTPPPSDGERRSDPGAELSVEDLVVEAVAPPKVPASLPPMRAKAHSTPSFPPGVGKRTPGPGPAGPVMPPSPKAPLVIVPPHVGTVAPAQEGSGLRRKGRLWWEDLFNDDYLRTCEKLTDEQYAREVDFIEDSLGIERGGAVLDLGCGTGRHAIELARRGYEVVGFDLALAMLARAGDEAQEREAKLTFVQGDMREMTFEEQFDGVYCWNTTFGYFEEDKNAAVIDRVHRSLRAGGLFLLDVANRDFLIRQSPSLAWFEGDGCVCMDEMSVDFITSRMKVKRTMMLDDGRSREIEYSMRVYSLHELGKILHEHGFKVTEVSGRLATPGVYFGNESPRTIILAEKR
jgi:SAM-dependent methyltransferase